MDEIKVNATKPYSVYISNCSLDFKLLLEDKSIKNIFIITDENVYNNHKKFIDELKDRAIGIKILKPGEESKSLDTVVSIYNELLKANVNRETHIAAIGGGVVGDISGFVASTFMRGINIIQVPTTLMAQCDSSIGGKNGFNYKGLKNIIGTFYQPKFVYIDINFLKTLNEREFKSGISEIIKYGYACDESLFSFILKNKSNIKERKTKELLYIVNKSAAIKGSIVERDELDLNLRQILNFGHTIGHAIESLSYFQLSHGEAVSIGMYLESYLSYKIGYLKWEELESLRKLIEFFKLPYFNKNINYGEIIGIMQKDKKKISNNIKFALPDKVGHAIITTDITNDQIIECLNELKGRL
ncbi:3-dehydroquinate synthase [Fervidicella metallireducens AeB]|uniref:3-dehydroquinate synthase n=1 Tax=Fervidicella metallireducens AeB TaxID=1403537 RepID=A0A017RUH3_9CLOT|nr:3-dehydroquinate synthase [Fervidicella metallireducens]EYE88428.1 3-dehydroquinate synthase [Fervidicella metallireducens AeB]